MNKELVIFQPITNPPQPSIQVEWTSHYTKNAREIAEYLTYALYDKGFYYIEEILRNPPFRIEDRKRNNILSEIRSDLIDVINNKCIPTKDIGDIKILSKQDVIKCLAKYFITKY